MKIYFIIYYLFIKCYYLIISYYREIYIEERILKMYSLQVEIIVENKERKDVTATSY